jgi:hypothetical protein
VRRGSWAWSLCALCACQVVTGLDEYERGEARTLDAGAVMTEPSSDATPPTETQAGRGGSCEPCDPISQCGCSGGEHCQLRGGEPRCVRPGSEPIGASCSGDAECEAGSGCLDGICKRYCARDSDCDEGACAKSSSAGVKACLTRCDFGTQEPCAEPTVCARLRADAGDQFEIDGDFCVVPRSDCSPDQQCDEPDWGSRFCRAGADSADCSCAPQVAGASCDLNLQCGCAPGQRCALTGMEGASASLDCVEAPRQTRKRGEVCAGELECPAGYSCWRGMCEHYCSSDADCAGAPCVPINGGVSGVRVCAIACDFDTERGCATGTRCVHATAEVDYCLVARSPCPLSGDGTCDEPEGTRICVEASDPMDCP